MGANFTKAEGFDRPTSTTSSSSSSSASSIASVPLSQPTPTLEELYAGIEKASLEAKKDEQSGPKQGRSPMTAESIHPNKSSTISDITDSQAAWSTSLLVNECRRLLSHSSSRSSRVHPQGSLHSELSGLPSNITVIEERSPDAQPDEVTSNSSSRPVKFPARRSAHMASSAGVPISVGHSSASAEYMTRIYDLRTWNMYNLIMEARQRQQLPGPIPPLNPNQHSEHHFANGHIDGRHDDMLSHDDLDSDHAMIFSFDDHH
mmetsp:Transcript_13113/g.17241  ORF Transcript_13113/g.17241 Transcript_13113/m.17241 type:complete len:261 (+) Transcript_13113:75-857(+)